MGVDGSSRWQVFLSVLFVAFVPISQYVIHTFLLYHVPLLKWLNDLHWVLKTMIDVFPTFFFLALSMIFNA